MSDSIKIILDGKTCECPIITGVEGYKAVDISKLLAATSHITFDNGFANTGACVSKITFVDGGNGILRYRGYPIQELAQHVTFTETAYLLLEGELPTARQLQTFDRSVTKHLALPGGVLKSLESYPKQGHPMGALAAMICSLAGHYPESLNPDPSADEIREIIFQMLAKTNTLAACSYRHFSGKEFISPRKDLDYESNFLHMMFSTAKKDYHPDETVVSAIRTLLVLHADHEQNCSTSTVRLAGSSKANLFASISAGVCALWGPLHGGANQEVMEMLEVIHADGGDVQKFVNRAKGKGSSDKVRLMGFGHRVYKNYDPRAKIIKRRCMDILKKLGVHDPLLEVALKLEDAALKDPYFIERKLYPNVDFYSGLIYKAIGLPTVMFPVMFALGRMPGWLAHWKEMKLDPSTRIGRPRQVYAGPAERRFVPMNQR